MFALHKKSKLPCMALVWFRHLCAAQRERLMKGGIKAGERTRIISKEEWVFKKKKNSGQGGGGWRVDG